MIEDIDGDLIGGLYDVMPDDIQGHIRAALGALIWRRSAVMIAERHPEALAARGFAWALLTNGGETTLRQAREGAAEAGGLVRSASLLIGAFESAKTGEQTRLAIADAERILSKSADEDVPAWLDRMMGADEDVPAWLERTLGEGDQDGI